MTKALNEYFAWVKVHWQKPGFWRKIGLVLATAAFLAIWLMLLAFLGFIFLIFMLIIILIRAAAEAERVRVVNAQPVVAYIPPQASLLAPIPSADDDSFYTVPKPEDEPGYCPCGCGHYMEGDCQMN
jgi:hypothetical protein